MLCFILSFSLMLSMMLSLMLSFMLFLILSLMLSLILFLLISIIRSLMFSLNLPCPWYSCCCFKVDNNIDIEFDGGWGWVVLTQHTNTLTNKSILNCYGSAKKSTKVQPIGKYTGWAGVPVNIAIQLLPTTKYWFLTGFNFNIFDQSFSFPNFSCWVGVKDWLVKLQLWLVW